jgi:hypothetical protein
MSGHRPSKHWLMALIPLSVAFAALSNNFIFGKSRHLDNSPIPMENKGGIRVKNSSLELKQHDTAGEGTNIDFKKTDTVKSYRQPEVSLKTGKEVSERLHKNGRFNIDID